MYRYGLIYRQVLRMPPFNVCQVAQQTDILTKQVVTFVESFAPGAFKACPRTVKIYFCTISIFCYVLLLVQELTFKEVRIPTTKLLDVFPSGDYRAIFLLSLIKNEFLFNITADVTNTSPDKNVYG